MQSVVESTALIESENMCMQAAVWVGRSTSSIPAIEGDAGQKSVVWWLQETVL